jgi:hypothetical protein
MSRRLFVLTSNYIRDEAAKCIAAAPTGTRVEIKAAKRTLPQNAKMWAVLTDLAHQLPWHGQMLTPDDFKLLGLDALKRESRLVPNLDNTGFVNLGRSSSDLSKQEMADLIELLQSFGSNHGVQFHDGVAA